jgi:hypothetical protein
LPAVTFYPDKTIHLDVRETYFHQSVNHYILNSLKATGLLITNLRLKEKSDYFLKVDHAIGCPNLGESENCNILILWNLYRGDNAPVTSWQAYYKIDIPVKIQLNRFRNYDLPKKMIALIGDDFIKSLIFETLKNQDTDYVYIFPDKLTDETTLCSAESLIDTYTYAGLFVTDKVYEARFLIKTDVQFFEPDSQTNLVTLVVQRIILDRVTGEYQVYPVKTKIESDYLYNDSYDCKQSALITMKNVGIFIDNAPLLSYK